MNIDISEWEHNVNKDDYVYLKQFLQDTHNRKIRRNEIVVFYNDIDESAAFLFFHNIINKYFSNDMKALNGKNIACSTNFYTKSQRNLTNVMESKPKLVMLDDWDITKNKLAGTIKSFSGGDKILYKLSGKMEINYAKMDTNFIMVCDKNTIMKYKTKCDSGLKRRLKFIQII